jgi:hypothetical protein
MKQTYTTPVINASGSVVETTRNSTQGLIEPAGFQKRSGAVGFNL